MPTEDERIIADEERQQRRQSQADAVGKASADTPPPIPHPSAWSLATAQALQWSWRFYLPSFTVTSLYIVFHMVCRYIMHFNVFCRAHEGSPLAVGQTEKLAAFYKTHRASGAADWAQRKWNTAGGLEAWWVAMSFASALPLAIALLLLYALVYTAMNPFDAIVAAFSSLLGLDGGGGTSGGGGASGGY